MNKNKFNRITTIIWHIGVALLVFNLVMMFSFLNFSGEKNSSNQSDVMFYVKGSIFSLFVMMIGTIQKTR